MPLDLDSLSLHDLLDCQTYRPGLLNSIHGLLHELYSLPFSQSEDDSQSLF